MQKVIVAITGASGSIYGIKMAEELKKAGAIVHLVISEASIETIEIETNLSIDSIKEKADYYYEVNDITAPIASGSFDIDGMVVAPCSIKTLSSVANCFADNLISRACDVTLKERRPLILLVREAPYHLGHIKLMEKATLYGGIILPPVTALYAKQKTIDDVINHTIGKTLDLLGIENSLYNRWE